MVRVLEVGGLEEVGTFERVKEEKEEEGVGEGFQVLEEGFGVMGYEGREEGEQLDYEAKILYLIFFIFFGFYFTGVFIFIEDNRIQISRQIIHQVL